MDVNTQCPRCAASRASLVRDGFYHRADDSKSIQRFKCTDCGKKFSAATLKPTYRQKKRRINATVRTEKGMITVAASGVTYLNTCVRFCPLMSTSKPMGMNTMRT